LDIIIQFFCDLFEIVKKSYLSFISLNINLTENIEKAFFVISHYEHFNTYHIAKALNSCWIYILFFLTLFRCLYAVIGCLTTRKFNPATKKHKYGILIAARNEESVIGNLLESIKKQDYSSELLTVFVVADNCTDSTAEIARRSGAICYERFDNEHKTKGYALQFLLNKIEEDYKRESFEGFFIFDADNLLSNDYVSRMNDSFDAGEKIITSYRNTKNFDDNWISASYGLHWLRTTIKMHRGRSLLRLATHIQGTGFLFATELVKDGWKFTSFTEDRAFTAEAVINGYKISYNDDAVFFDEQPVNLKIAFRQRLRWAKGHLLVFLSSGWKLFKASLINKSFLKRFMSFDMFIQVTPRTLFLTLRRFLVATLFIYTYIHFGFLSCLYKVLCVELSMRVANYIVSISEAMFIFFFERKRIKKINPIKKVWYCITWPLFDIIGNISMFLAVFMKVTWKPIPHTSQVKIDDKEAIYGVK